MAWKINHGDCLEIMRQIAAATFDGCVTDPPYSSGGMMRGDRTASTRQKYCQTGAKHDISSFSGDNRDQRGYLAWSTLWMSEARRATKPGGIIAVFTDWRQLPTTTDAIQAAGWVWRGIAPWVKKTARPVKGRYCQQAEFVVWGTNGPRPIDGKCARGAWIASTPGMKQRVHQTQKPDDVMAGILSVFEAGQSILDPFAGSGSTGRAAVSLGLDFTGIEMLQEFCDLAGQRIRAIEADSGPLFAQK